VSRFLATREAKKPGFFSESVGDIEILWKKPGFWLPVSRFLATREAKKPGFLPSLLVIPRYCGKNPVSGYLSGYS